MRNGRRQLVKRAWIEDLMVIVKRDHPEWSQDRLAVERKRLNMLSVGELGERVRKMRGIK